MAVSPKWVFFYLSGNSDVPVKLTVIFLPADLLFGLGNGVNESACRDVAKPLIRIFSTEGYPVLVIDSPSFQVKKRK